MSAEDVPKETPTGPYPPLEDSLGSTEIPSHEETPPATSAGEAGLTEDEALRRLLLTGLLKGGIPVVVQPLTKERTPPSPWPKKVSGPGSGHSPNQTGQHYPPDTAPTFTFKRRKDVVPGWVPGEPQATPSRLVPRDLTPRPETFTDRPAIHDLMGERGTPAVRVPRLLGLRDRVLDRRINRKQRKIEQLSQRPATDRERRAQYVGQKIMAAEGYWTDDAEHRPRTFADRVTANLMEKMAAGRRQRIARAHNNARLFGAREIEDFEEPEFGGAGTHRTGRTFLPGRGNETREGSLKSRRYRKDMAQASRRDRVFTALISPRLARLDRLTRSRDRLRQRQHVIRNLREGRDPEWYEEPPEIEGQIIQLGNPDARGKVTLGEAFTNRGDEIDLTTNPHTRSEHSREVIFLGDGIGRYLRGNRLYSWRVDDTGHVTGINMPQIISEAELSRPVRIGEGWPLGNMPRDDAAAEINALMIRAGNLDADTAIDRSIPRLPRDMFVQVQQIVEAIEADYEARLVEQSSVFAVRDRIFNEIHRPATAQEIADETGMDEDRVQRILENPPLERI